MAIERAKFEDLHKDEKYQKEPYFGKNTQDLVFIIFYHFTAIH